MAAVAAVKLAMVMRTKEGDEEEENEEDDGARGHASQLQAEPVIRGILGRLVRVPIQLAKKPLEKSLEKPLEISYTGKTPKMGSLDMSQNQIWISNGFSSDFSSGYLAN